MDKHRCIIIEMQNEAYLSYFKLCNMIKEAPREEIYNLISDCNDSKKLHETISFINQQKEAFKQTKSPVSKNLFQKLFKH